MYGWQFQEKQSSFGTSLSKGSVQVRELFSAELVPSSGKSLQVQHCPLWAQRGQEQPGKEGGI